MQTFKLLILFFIFSIAVNAQKFSEKNISIFSEMGINYGNAVADYDLDGDLDVFIVAYNSFDKNDSKTWSRLLNNRGGRFEDVTEAAGFSNQHSIANKSDLKLGVAWGDYNNDGYPDLLLAHQNGTQLYKNTGNGTFTDVSAQANITSCNNNCSNTGGLWWDYDNDGDLDLYLQYLNTANRLFTNNNDGTFTEIEGALNLNDPHRTWSCLPIDVNYDGWMDIYVVNDFGLSKFYLSQEGKSFVESTEAYNLVNLGCGMGSDIGDYNNDGYFDIYVTNIAEGKSNPLFMGTPGAPFENKTAVEKVGNGHFGWGTRIFDADNDGDQDIYVVNGDNDLHYKNVFFKNLRREGTNNFEEWSNQSDANGIANGMGAEVFDFDDDGDLDILVSNTNNAPYLYENIIANPNSWLQVNLEGVTANRNAFGAIISAFSEGKAVHRLNHGATIMGQSIKPIHFGLGDAKKIDSLIVKWPHGEKEVVYDIDKNQKITFIEGLGMTDGKTYEATENEEENGEETQTPESEEISLSCIPNPFSLFTEFKINTISQTSLEINIYSISGFQVWNLYRENIPEGEWSEKWYGESQNGHHFPAGLYIYQIKLDNKTWTGKLVLKS